MARDTSAVIALWLCPASMSKSENEPGAPPVEMTYLTGLNEPGDVLGHVCGRDGPPAAPLAPV